MSENYFATEKQESENKIENWMLNDNYFSN